jgi:hypothetical protein
MKLASRFRQDKNYVWLHALGMPVTSANALVPRSWIADSVCLLLLDLRLFSITYYTPRFQSYSVERLIPSCRMSQSNYSRCHDSRTGHLSHPTFTPYSLHLPHRSQPYSRPITQLFQHQKIFLKKKTTSYVQPSQLHRSS